MRSPSSNRVYQFCEHHPTVNELHIQLQEPSTLHPCAFKLFETMAQVDTSIVTKLRKAILNICPYPRGCRRFSDIIGHTLPHREYEEGNELIKFIGELLDERIFNSVKIYFDNEAPFQLEDILISGSCSEGMHKVNLETLSISDIDFMLILKNIKVTEEDQKKGNLTVQENTPFVNLYFTDEDVIEMWTDFLEPSVCEKNFRLSPKKLKIRFREKYVTCGPFYCSLVEENVKDVDEGPSVALESKLPSGKIEVTNQSHMGHFPLEEFDFVLAIKCDGWPLCAQEWRSRPRCWPSQEIVQKIIESGFHIVCKSSSEGGFRLSYSNAETILIQSLSGLQHKTYRAFKSFVSHYKDEWNRDGKKIICSYHLKTILLWYCEKSDPKIWTEERIVYHLLILIDDLISALKERNLPMYFMPKYNLMDQVEDASDVVEKITELRESLDSITKAIISEEPDIREWKKFIFNSIIPGYLERYEKSLDEGKFNPKDFLQYGKSMLEGCDKFWINSTGGIPPPRTELQREGAFNTFYELTVKFLEKYCERINADCENESLRENMKMALNYFRFN